MAKKQEETITPEAAVQTELIQVRLSEIEQSRRRYCHRDDGSLDPASSQLKVFAEQILREGMQTPVEVYMQESGRPILIKGYRRIAVLNELARTKQTGYSEDMLVPAFKVVDADPRTLLVRSVGDNENRLNFNAHERIRAAKTMHDNDVPTPRAASALGISTTSYERALLIASHDWMFHFVVEKCIDPTPAHALLDAAVKSNRLDELREFFDRWVEVQKEKIHSLELKKAEVNKELGEAEKQVKRYLLTHLWKSWVSRLKKKLPLQDQAEWRFGAELDHENRKLSIASLTLNLSKADASQIDEVAAKLANLAEELKPYQELKRIEERLRKQRQQDQPTTDPEPDDDDGKRFEQEITGKIDLPEESEDEE